MSVIFGDRAVQVLVIEDEVFIRLDVSDALRKAGFEVVEVNTADDALVFLEAGEHVDVVFTDIRLPGKLDGLGLAESARQICPVVPVVITSGDLEKSSAASQLGKFVPKPYAPNDIISLIENLFSSTSSRPRSTFARRSTYER